MNERYLFRGKSIDGHNSWITGHLAFLGIHGEDIAKYPIIYRDFDPPRDDQNSYTVIPATIGQCTGLRDKNGTLIFEGDVVSISEHIGGVYPGVIEWGNEVNADGGKEGNQNDAWIVLWGAKDSTFRHDLGFWATRTIEVVGNIHDNPKLMDDAEAVSE